MEKSGVGDGGGEGWNRFSHFKSHFLLKGNGDGIVSWRGGSVVVEGVVVGECCPIM